MNQMQRKEENHSNWVSPFPFSKFRRIPWLIISKATKKSRVRPPYPISGLGHPQLGLMCCPYYFHKLCYDFSGILCTEWPKIRELSMLPDKAFIVPCLKEKMELDKRARSCSLAFCSCSVFP